MVLTKKQEKKLIKSFDNPKKLRKWIDDVYSDMINQCEEKTEKIVLQYLDIYSIAVAYTLNYACGFGKKRLPQIMQRIWNNIDSFKSGHLSLEDCIEELSKAGIEFNTVIKNPGEFFINKEKKDDNR